MLIATVSIVGLGAIAAMLVIGQHSGVFATPSPSLPAHPLSALDEAERILAHRYATGQITPAEYQRMLTILRR